MEVDETILAGDLIVGAEQIADFLGLDRRKIYHMAAQDHLPIFRIGSALCCRKSTLTRWILTREQRSAAMNRGVPPAEAPARSR